MSEPTYLDIMSEGQTLGATVAALARRDLPDFAAGSGMRYVFTGSGSSYYAAAAGAELLRHLTGLDASARPASEVWLLPDRHLTPATVLVAFSRTGTTTEPVGAVAQASERGVRSIAVSLAGDSPLLESADEALHLASVPERGRVMTGSFANLMLASQWIAAEIAARHGVDVDAYRQGFGILGQAVSDALPGFDELAREVAAVHPPHHVFLGLGPNLPSCTDAALKVKEMTRLAAESYSPLEFRHGPIATLTPETCVWIVSSTASAPFDSILVDDLELLGGHAWVIGPPLSRTLPPNARAVPSDERLPDWLQGNFAAPLLQLVTYHQTLALGLDPQSVRHLDRRLQPHVDPHVVDLDSTPR